MKSAATRTTAEDKRETDKVEIIEQAVKVWFLLVRESLQPFCFEHCGSPSSCSISPPMRESTLSAESGSISSINGNRMHDSWSILDNMGDR